MTPAADAKAAAGIEHVVLRLVAERDAQRETLATRLTVVESALSSNCTALLS